MMNNTIMWCACYRDEEDEKLIACLSGTEWQAMDDLCVKLKMEPWLAAFRLRDGTIRLSKVMLQEVENDH